MRQGIFPWRALTLCLLGLSVILGITLYVIPVFFPWSEWHCRHQEIDINSGRLKFSRYVFFFKISEEIRDSALSMVLKDDSVDMKFPSWQRVNTFSPGMHNSPHYVFHGAINDARQLSMWWKAVGASEEVRQTTAKHLITLWNYGDGDELSGDYVNNLPDTLAWNSSSNVLGTLLSLPMPLVKTNAGTVTSTVFYPTGVPMESKQGFFNQKGEFVLDGEFLGWRADAGISVYGHFTKGCVDGPWFNWDRHGALEEIAVYEGGERVDDEYQQLSAHPYYDATKRVASTNQPIIPE